MSYRDYLNSDWWVNKRKNAKRTKTYENGCLICGRHDVDLHHLTYTALGKERLNKHLVVLCRDHHEAFHNWQKENNKLVGDISEFMQEFHPKRWKRLNNLQKKIAERYSSEKIEKKNERDLNRLETLRNIVLNVDGEYVTLGKEQRKLFPNSFPYYMACQLGLDGDSYQDKIASLQKPIRKENIISFIDNYPEIKLESDRLKKERQLNNPWRKRY